jgi:hypothetical protein
MRPLILWKLGARCGAVAALLLFPYTLYAADCTPFAKEPEVRFEFSRPSPVYKSVPALHIMEIEGVQNPMLTRGLTKANFFISYDFKLAGHSVQGGYCAAINEIVFRMGYSNMDVFIDERYREGTCEYYILRSHEAQHVKIHNDVLERYIPIIRDEIIIASMNIEPVFVKSMGGVDMNRILRRAVTENERIALLVQRMEDELLYLNLELDSPEEYERISSLCDNW